MRTGHDHVLEIGLIAALYAVVLAIGGTETFVFAAVQFAVLLLAVLLVWKAAGPGGGTFPWLGPALLIGWVAMQAAILGPEGHSARDQLPRWVATVAVFCLASSVARDAGARRRLVASLILLGVAEAGYGLVQYLTGWQQVYTLKKRYYTAQATGTYVNPNHFAGLLEMVAPLVLACALERWERRGRETGERASSAFFFALTALLLAAVLFSRSRMGILSAMASLLGMALLWLASMPRRRAAAAAVAGFFAVSLGLGAWIGLGPVLQRFGELNKEASPRLAIWRDSVQLVREHPWLGTGLGSFGQMYPRVQSTLQAHVVEHAHNDYVQFAVELGLPGAVVLFGLVAAVVARGLAAGLSRSRHLRDRLMALGAAASVAALLLHSVADFNLQIPANAMVFAALVGLLHGITQESRLAQRKRRDAATGPSPNLPAAG